MNHIIIIDNEEECAICYENLHNEYIQPCKHPVHYECFLKTNKNICPICRQKIIYPRQYDMEDFYIISIILILVLTGIAINLFLKRNLF